MVRIGSALLSADHTRLGDELHRAEAGGVEFFHLLAGDGFAAADLGFSTRTVKALRSLSSLPFEVHLSTREPLHFLPGLQEAGANLIFLDAENTPQLDRTIVAVHAAGIKVGLCLALGSPLSFLSSRLAMVDAILLQGLPAAANPPGRDLKRLLLQRALDVRHMVDAGRYPIDLQVITDFDVQSCVDLSKAGVNALPLGELLHRESDAAAFITCLRGMIEGEATSSGSARHAGKAHASKFKVLVASRSFSRNCPEVLERMREQGCEFLPSELEHALSEDDVIAQIGEAHALISGMEPVTARVLAAAPHLKVISKHGLSCENIDLEAAKARRVAVTIAAGAVADSVADMVLALILALARKITQSNDAVKSGAWPTRSFGIELRGKTIGIVGMGQIGKSVCRRARAFGANVIASDASPDPAYNESWGVKYVSFEQLLSQADFVTLHAPSNSSSEPLMGAAQLGRMKPGACLINTAHADLLDENALCEALRSNALSGAACDVFHREPPGENALLTLPNFIATPHCAGHTIDGLRRMGEITGENALRVLRGEEPLYRLV